MKLIAAQGIHHLASQIIFLGLRSLRMILIRQPLINPLQNNTFHPLLGFLIALSYSCIQIERTSLGVATT